MPRFILRLEGATVLAVAIALYFINEGGWLMFFLLFLVPDISMLGYFANPRTGSVTYNVIHTYLLPIGLIAFSALNGLQPGILVGLIWIAHLGMDRMLGFGLKYPTAFRDTHLNRV